jgi:hypothetical protein
MIVVKFGIWRYLLVTSHLKVWGQHTANGRVRNNAWKCRTNTQPRTLFRPQA